MEQKHAACVECCLYDIYTDIPCLEMSGSNDMAVLNQVCFQTLFFVRDVNAIPNRILFHERNGVQQDFEKGRSQRLWFRRYDRYKNHRLKNTWIRNAEIIRNDPRFGT